MLETPPTITAFVVSKFKFSPPAPINDLADPVILFPVPAKIDELELLPVNVFKLPTKIALFSE